MRTFESNSSVTFKVLLPCVAQWRNKEVLEQVFGDKSDFKCPPVGRVDGLVGVVGRGVVHFYWTGRGERRPN